MESICSFLAARTLELEDAAYPALDELTSQVIVISHLQILKNFVVCLSFLLACSYCITICKMCSMQINSRNLDRVRKFKSAMTRLTARVQKVIMCTLFMLVCLCETFFIICNIISVV